MILLISGIALVLGIIILMFSEFWQIWGLVFVVFATFFGFLILGTTVPVETVTTIPEDAFIQKNDLVVVLVVPNVGNKVIIDPAIVNHIEVSDTIKISKDYNSYGVYIDPIRIYVEKNGWKY